MNLGPMTIGVTPASAGQLGHRWGCCPCGWRRISATVSLLCLWGIVWWLTATVARAQEDIEFYEAEGRAIAAAVDRVAAAVVQIEVVGVAEVSSGEAAVDAPTAGTVIDPSGWVIASSLVNARPASSILVVLSDGTRLPARVVAEDKGREIVLLKVEPQGELPAISLAEPQTSLQIGQYAIAVGRVRNSGPAARSVGILSAMGRLNGRAMQTDARVSPPFYGGPLINIFGEVLGIVVPAMPEEGGAGDKLAWYDSGIAFVTPLSQIRDRLERLRQGENIGPGKLGIVAATSDSLVDGTSISAVRVGSPAAEVGMLAGDQIETINGQPVRRHADIKLLLGPLDAGQSVELGVRRGEELLVMRPVLVDEIPPFDPQTLGVWVREEGARMIVTGVFNNSAAAVAGIQVNDEIVAIDGQAIRDMVSLRNRVMALRPGKEITVTVLREGNNLDLRAVPDRVAGRLGEQLPSFPGGVEVGNWVASELALPEVANKAWMVAPAERPEGVPLGLLMIFAEPGAGDLAAAVETWKEQAQAERTIVVLVGSVDAKAWNPEEVEVGARLVATIRQRFELQPHAVAVTGDGVGGTMALVASFLNAGTYAGVAVKSEVKPPAMQLRENDPASPLHILVQGDQRPGWAEAVSKVGYAVLQGSNDRQSLFHYVWYLARI